MNDNFISLSRKIGENIGRPIGLLVAIIIVFDSGREFLLFYVFSSAFLGGRMEKAKVCKTFSGFGPSKPF